MKTVLRLTVVGCALAAASLAASASQELASKKNCMACHAADKKLVGPSFKDIASKYGAQKDAVDVLSQKILKGGSGTWGPVPMPANPQVSDAEAKDLVRWILTVK
ncbi:c-type cytochrome [Piscinibacter sakaiensis]|uniref:c-type cytochrome n=1 Tax=Piscinibacter sakaiensis TaxID=1547922 RepID=UPI003AAFB90C